MAEPPFTVPNLVDPRTYAEHDMGSVWRGLRAHDPVHWHEETTYGPGFWVLTRYEDVSQVLRDERDFTSEAGNVLATMLQGGDTAAGRMLAVTDGEFHTELRKLLLQSFAPRALEGVVRHVRKLTRRLIMNAIESGHCDFARDIASPISLETICDLLDVPMGDRLSLQELSGSALASEHESSEADTGWSARSEILIYFSNLLMERRKSPGDDPISIMASAEVAGKPLGDVDIVFNCYSLILGGDETSRLAMTGTIKAFIEHPDQWSALKNGNAAVAQACEEVLRWTTPAMHFGRRATREVMLRGRRIASGDLVTVWLVSANRDQEVFPGADDFRLNRSPNKHLTFGYGPHFCLGAYLGRMEVSTMLDSLRALVGRLEPAGHEQRIYSNFLSGLSGLPVTLEGSLRPGYIGTSNG
jgi:cytochrome P450